MFYGYGKPKKFFNYSTHKSIFCLCFWATIAIFNSLLSFLFVYFYIILFSTLNKKLLTFIFFYILSLIYFKLTLLFSYLFIFAFYFLFLLLFYFFIILFFSIKNNLDYFLFFNKKIAHRNSWISININHFKHRFNGENNGFILKFKNNQLCIVSLFFSADPLRQRIWNKISNLRLEIIQILDFNTVLCRILNINFRVPYYLSNNENRLTLETALIGWFYFQKVNLKKIFGEAKEWNALSPKDKEKKLIQHNKKGKKKIAILLPAVYNKFLFYFKTQTKRWRKEFVNNLLFLIVDILVLLMKKTDIVLNLKNKNVWYFLRRKELFNTCILILDDLLLNNQVNLSTLLSFLNERLFFLLINKIIQRLKFDFKGWSSLSKDQKREVYSFFKEFLGEGCWKPFSIKLSRIALRIKNFLYQNNIIYIKKVRANLWLYGSQFIEMQNHLNFILDNKKLPQLFLPTSFIQNKYGSNHYRYNKKRQAEGVIRYNQQKLKLFLHLSGSFWNFFYKMEGMAWKINELFLNLLIKVDKFALKTTEYLDLPFYTQAQMNKLEQEIAITNKHILTKEVRKKIKELKINSETINEFFCLEIGITLKKYKLHILACKNWYKYLHELERRKKFEETIFYAKEFLNYHFYMTAYVDYRLRFFNNNKILGNTSLGSIYKLILSSTQMSIVTIPSYIILLRVYFSYEDELKIRFESFLLKYKINSKNLKQKLYTFYLTNKMKTNKKYLENALFKKEIKLAFETGQSNFLLIIDAKSSCISLVSLIMSDLKLADLCGLIKNENRSEKDVYLYVLSMMNFYLKKDLKPSILNKMHRMNIERTTRVFDRDLIKTILISYFNGGSSWGRMEIIFKSLNKRNIYLTDSMMEIMKTFCWGFQAFIFFLFPSLAEKFQEINILHEQMLKNKGSITLNCLDGNFVNYRFFKQTPKSKTTVRICGKKENVYKPNIGTEILDMKKMNRVFFSNLVSITESFFLRNLINQRHDLQKKQNKRIENYLTCFDSVSINLKEFKFFFQTMENVYFKVKRNLLIRLLRRFNNLKYKNLLAKEEIKNKTFNEKEFDVKKMWR